MKEILKKFTSRKFLAMVTSVVVSILVYAGAEESFISDVVALIGLFGSIVTYILVEGSIDKKNNLPPTNVTNIVNKEKETD